MATLDQIDVTKPLVFYGTRTTISDDPELTRLAASTGMPQMRHVFETVTDEFALSPTDGAKLLDYVRAHPQRDLFEANLQGLSQTDDFTRTDVGAGASVHLLLGRLGAAADWCAAGVQDVFFDGYAQPRSNGREAGRAPR